MKIHRKQGNQPNPHIVWHQKCEISIKIPLMTAKKCKISSSSSPNLEKNWNLGSGPNVVLALELFTYYVSNVYVPWVRANADQVPTTPPRVSRDPKKCWRNMWMAPKSCHRRLCNAVTLHLHFDLLSVTESIKAVRCIPVCGIRSSTAAVQAEIRGGATATNIRRNWNVPAH